MDHLDDLDPIDTRLLDEFQRDLPLVAAALLPPLA
jgi:hypothetical protein